MLIDMQPRSQFGVRDAQTTHRSQTEEVTTVILDREGTFLSTVIMDAQLKIKGKEGELLLLPRRKVTEVKTKVLQVVRSLHGTTVYVQQGIDIEALAAMDEKSRKAKLARGYTLFPLFHSEEALSPEEIVARATYFTPMPELEELIHLPAAKAAEADQVSPGAPKAQGDQQADGGNSAGGVTAGEEGSEPS